MHGGPYIICTWSVFRYTSRLITACTTPTPVTISLYDYTQELAGLFTLSSQKGWIVLIWAQTALRKLTAGADLTVVARYMYTANTKVDGCSFMAGMAQFSPFLDICTYMFLNISFDFVHAQMQRSTGRINSTAAPGWICTNYPQPTVLQFSGSHAKSWARMWVYRYLTEIVRHGGLLSNEWKVGPPPRKIEMVYVPHI